MQSPENPPGFEKAHAMALDDMRNFGAGYLMVTAAGYIHLAPQAVAINRAKFLEATHNAKS